MKDLLLYVAKNLVDNPDAVNVTETEHDDSVVLELRVAPGDMGKVIGHQGRIAKEIRTLLKAAGLKENKKVTVDIVD
ncbi:MAG: KH domain-containing protein [Clostridiales bacterium]|nr:KH domain-containing protein [Clostridiales bacterium]